MIRLSLIYIFIAFTVFTQTFWVEQNSGVSVSLNSVVNSNWIGAGWICGNNGTVIRTTNDGTNWINVSGNGIPGDIQLNTITDDVNYPAYAITAGRRLDTAIVYLTTNAGANWQIVFRQYSGRINGISLGYQNGFMVGNPVGGRWSIWKSTNDGLTWDSSGLYVPQNNNETGWNNSFKYTNPLVAFGTNNSRLYYSTNSGVAWSFRTINGMTNISSIDFASPGAPNYFYGYVAGTNKILFTSDGGSNWISDTSMPGNGNVIGLHAQPLPVDFFGQNSIITTKGDNKIYWQFAYSNIWVLHFTAPAGNYTHIANKMYNKVWAVRDNGGITFCGCDVSGINIISGNLPVDFTLYQNYPNPFNPVTNIKFDLPKSGLDQITIFDILGREVTQLVNQQLQPGSYSVDWDASNYPSGVYFYSLVAGSYAETKKMVLIK